MRSRQVSWSAWLHRAFRRPGQRPVRRLVGAALALAVAACSPSGDRAEGAAAAPVDLLGAGATFPYPLYSRWFNAYALETGVRVNYQSIGSGGGIRQLIAGTVDFGATDVPMTDEEMARVRGGRVIHVPTVLGAVGVTYNLPSLSRPLRLDGDALAGIFLGEITRWDDDRLAALNPDLPLPDRDVLVVHRSDGSGTSYIFSDYLTSVSATWAAGPGRSKDVRWPVGLGGKGNEGVAGQVKQMPGAIGYVESSYARQNRLPLALVRNRAGKFVAPSGFEMDAAATSALSAAGDPDDLRISLVNASGADAYPITSFTWILVAPGVIGPKKTASLFQLLRWALSDGGELARGIGFQPLGPELGARLLTSLDEQLTAASREPAQAAVQPD